LSSLPTIVVLGNCESHNDTDYESSQVTQVVDIGFWQTNLDVKQ
jgi:hypothetical protein